jgi:hypothetical protein
MKTISWPHHLMTASICSALLWTETKAQTPTASPGDRSVTVIPGPDYAAAGIKRKFLGEGWRDVWLTPTLVPVFDIGTYAGGVKATRKGGGNQTRTIHLGTSDGRDFLFRSVNKFPVGQAMPAAVRNSTLGDVIQDQVSSLFPAGALMVRPLLQANDILHVGASLYFMPDDPRLGEFRSDFRDMLGTVELSPQEDENNQPGFADSRQIMSSDKFLEEVEKSRVHHLDERELFAVRLIDFLANDNDRTTDNMRFARYGDEKSYTWRPLPRDRDRAFSDAGGWLIKYIVHPIYPKLIEFQDDYDLVGLVFESYNIDRRLLQRLTRADAEATALRVQKALSNDVIDKSIAALPREWKTKREVVARLRNNMRARRDRLPEVARDFYDWLATEVDVHGTDESERAIVDRNNDGSVTVTIRGKKESDAVVPFFRRTFLRDETNEVRVYLHSGDDVGVIRGAATNDITVRVIGGGDDDLLVDSAGGGKNRFYDEKGKNKYVRKSGTKVSEKNWDAPRQGGGIRFDAPWRPDWGKSNGWGPAFDYVQGGGLVVGFGPRYESNGFRRLPHKWKAGANVLVGTGNGKFGANGFADYRFENSPSIFRLDARGTAYEEYKFYGYGNTSVNTGNRARVTQDLIAIEPQYIRQIGWRSRENLSSGFEKNDSVAVKLRPLVGAIHVGPVVLWNRSDPRDELLFAPVELKDVLRAGARLGLELDKTSSGPPSDRGFTLNTSVEGYPAVLDLDEALTIINAVGAAYMPITRSGTHIAVRAGAATASGPTPVQQAPHIGGNATVRGYASHRYVGDRSGFGSAEVRFPLATVPVIVNWKTGVFGLVDVGRVWLDGESPGGWHKGVGGGLWFSSLGQTFSVAYAHGDEHRFYLQKGMSF